MGNAKVRYLEFSLIESINNPDGNFLARSLEAEISEIQSKLKLKLASACFLSREELGDKEQKSGTKVVVYKYMLFFDV